MYRPGEWLDEWIPRGRRADLTVSARALAPPKGRPLELIEDSGTGKSRLLIAAGTAIAAAGRSVRCTTTPALVNKLAESGRGQAIEHRHHALQQGRPVVPERVRVPDLDEKGTKPPFQIFTEQQERKATGSGLQRPVQRGGQNLRHLKFCAAAADRLACKGVLIQTGIDSCRLKTNETEHHTTRRP